MDAWREIKRRGIDVKWKLISGISVNSQEYMEICPYCLITSAGVCESSTFHAAYEDANSVSKKFAGNETYTSSQKYMEWFNSLGDDLGVDEAFHSTMLWGPMLHAFNMILRSNRGKNYREVGKKKNQF